MYDLGKGHKFDMERRKGEKEEGKREGRKWRKLHKVFVKIKAVNRCEMFKTAPDTSQR